jgi:ATPase subunit of ABC transporter with duplicated ATPase domains
MKRLFWSVLLAIGSAIGVWFITRRRMDTLYGELSRLREVERKYESLVEKEAQREQAFIISEADAKEFEEEMASASTDKKMRMAMLSALYKDQAHNALGDYDNDLEEDES